MNTTGGGKIIAEIREKGKSLESGIWKTGTQENRKGEASGRGKTLELRFDHSARVNHLVTMEDLRYGHIMRAYTLEAFQNGVWKRRGEGRSIGHKKIDVMDATEVEGLRLVVSESADEPVIKSFAVYEASVVCKSW